MPSPLESSEGDGREATWIAWSDPEHVAAATRAGDVLFLSIRREDVRQRMDELAAITP